MEEVKQVTTYIHGTERVDMNTNKGDTHKWVLDSNIESVKSHLIGKSLDRVFSDQCKVTYHTATSAMVGDVFFSKSFHPLNKEGDALIELLYSEDIVFVLASRYWTSNGILLDLIPCNMSDEVSIIDRIRKGKSWYSF